MHSPPNSHNRKRNTTGGTKIINNANSADEPDTGTPATAKFYLPNAIVKSMSDAACNISVNVEKAALLGSLYRDFPPPELDDHQATVGSGRGKWANELVAESKAAIAKMVAENGKNISPYASSWG